jgi:hypothetical protein
MKLVSIGRAVSGLTTSGERPGTYGCRFESAANSLATSDTARLSFVDSAKLRLLSMSRRVKLNPKTCSSLSARRYLP